MKITTGKVERLPLHKRIDKEKYQSDLEKFYNDGWDAAPVAQAHGASKKVNNDGQGSEMGEKIGKLQDEMSRQKQQFKKTEEVNRQKVSAQLVDKPKTHAQKFDTFLIPAAYHN